MILRSIIVEKLRVGAFRAFREFGVIGVFWLFGESRLGLNPVDASIGDSDFNY